MNIKARIQQVGRFLSGMVMPNIGAFIAWGLITALFIDTGWLPNKQFSALVGPMITYLLPLLIGYTGGKMVHNQKGAVIGAIATMGVIISKPDMPMFLGAMLVGPLAAWVLKKFDDVFESKVKVGFEMLYNNFSIGIIGMIIALIALVSIGPVMVGISNAFSTMVSFLVDRGLLFLTSIIVEPAKILFLNNAINHGIFTPLGTQQVAEVGKSIFFLIETNPGPGMGVLLAYMLFGKGSAKSTAPGAAIIHFFGGIHEIYFPYVLMKPQLVLAVIAGGMSGVATFSIFNVGLSASPSPGSILALLALTPKGSFLGVILGVSISMIVSFLVSSVIIKATSHQDEDFEEFQEVSSSLKAESKGLSKINKIIVACDAGMGSSAMGATMLKNELKKQGLSIEVDHVSIDQLDNSAQLIITHESLRNRAHHKVPNTQIITLTNFMDAGFYVKLVEDLKK